MTNDLISDMLTRIRNATQVKHSFTNIKFSKVNLAILKIFKAQGYIKSYSIKRLENNKFFIDVILRYKGWWIKKPFFSYLTRISKSGQRIFSSYKYFKKFISILKYKHGFALISTSIGVVTHSKATQLKKGGEILCYIG